MRFSSLLVCAIAFLAALQALRAQSPGPSALEALNKPIDVDFVEMPLKDVFTFFHDKTGIQFVLKQKKLEEASVGTDTPVTKSLKQVRLSTVLDLLLSDLELTYMEKDGLILITTPEDAENNLFVRVYNCRDLLEIASDPVVLPVSEKEATVSATPAGIGGYAGGTAKRPLPRTKQEHLMLVVTTSITPYSWDIHGGPGTISEFAGQIVVTQTNDVHKQIERLLDMLRESAGLAVPKGGKVVR